MDDREAFMAYCYDYHYEFSSLRRAMYSTTCILYKLNMEKNIGQEHIKEEFGSRINKNAQNLDMCIKSIEHAYNCTDLQCAVSKCANNKSLFEHTKLCTKQLDGSCSNCSKFISLLCYHAKNCKLQKCAMPFCLIIKLKRSHQLLTLKLQAESTHRRITTTNGLLSALPK